MIDYNDLLNKNITNVLKDILKHVKKRGLTADNQIFISFYTNKKSVVIPDWLKKKYPEEMTVVIQYEYYDLFIYETFFKITLSFNNIKTPLQIGFDSIISFSDPSKNFGIKLNNQFSREEKNLKNQNAEIDNVIDLANFKKN